MTEFIGYIGAFLLGICGIPEIISYFQTGTVGTSWGMLIIWLLGEVFALWYAFLKSKQIKLIPLLVNYGLNVICILFMMAVK